MRHIRDSHFVRRLLCEFAGHTFGRRLSHRVYLLIVLRSRHAYAENSISIELVIEEGREFYLIDFNPFAGPFAVTVQGASSPRLEDAIQDFNVHARLTGLLRRFCVKHGILDEYGQITLREVA